MSEERTISDERAESLARRFSVSADELLAMTQADFDAINAARFALRVARARARAMERRAERRREKLLGLR